MDRAKVVPELRIDEKEEEAHRLDSLILLLYTLLLAVTVVTVWMFKHRRIRYLHETGLALIYGLVIGAILRYGMSDFGALETMKVRPTSQAELRNGTVSGVPDILLLDLKSIGSKKARQQLLNKTLAYTFKGEVRDVDSVIEEKTVFDPELFFNVLLPPIIFQAGYSMKKRFFFRNIGSILTFAFAGTTISTFVVGGLMYGVTRTSTYLSSSFNFIDTLRFGASISATDPVTTLAIFNDLNVDVNLYALVFGESVLNDAVAIVITRTLEDYEGAVSHIDSSAGDVSTAYILLKSIGEFFFIFGASLTVGSLVGCFTALITKFTQIRQFPELEATLFILMSYSTFLLAEVLHLTGIVAVLFCGICQAHYTYNNLSTEAKAITRQFFNLLNFMAENFIFCYVGVSMFTFPKHKFDPAFISGSFFAIILGRALNVYPLAFLLNLGRRTKIPFNLQHMMFWSGLRGAIAFSLAVGNTLTDSRQIILSTTMLIVVVTVIVCGGSTMSLMTFLKIPVGSGEAEGAGAGAVEGAEDRFGQSEASSQYSSVGICDESLSQGDQQSQPQLKSWLAKIWSGLDKNLLKPLLTHSSPCLMETMPPCCLPLARCFTSAEQLSKHPAMNISYDQIGRGDPFGELSPDAGHGSEQQQRPGSLSTAMRFRRSSSTADSGDDQARGPGFSTVLAPPKLESPRHPVKSAFPQSHM